MGFFDKKNKSEKPDNAPTAVATPVAVDSGQAGASDVVTVTDSAPAALNDISDLPTVDDSPIEQRTHELVDDVLPEMPEWNHMTSAPHDGSRVMVSETGKDKGHLVYWRISKYVDKKNLRYIPKGRWTDSNTRLDITFEPKYWQKYDAEKFYPVQGIKA